MATQIEQPRATDSPTYEEDFYLWCYRTAELIRTGQFDQVDRENVAEEIESLARRDWAELKNRTIILLAHLLKRDYHPQKHTRSWDITIENQRRKIEININDVPSLRRRLPVLINDEYERAASKATLETGLPREAFPATCPFTVVQVYGDWIEKQAN